MGTESIHQQRSEKIYFGCCGKRAFEVNTEPFKRLHGFDKVAWFRPIKLWFALAANLTIGYNSFDVCNRIRKITNANKMR